ncbi:hypothetical protein TNCV_4081121 [Trichonephila clavipes]|nr:hypothetical protein TNCV_4081121 [Trichonephila clavipes]
MIQPRGVVKQVMSYICTARTPQWQKYLVNLQYVLSELLQEVPANAYQNMWCMHNGVPVHFLIVERNYLNATRTYLGRWTGHGGAIA